MKFLKNLKVIEFATVLAGPAVGAFFAELGADIVKVEPPKGDVTRHWKTPTEELSTDLSAYFTCVNWGKKSVVLDLKTPEGKVWAQRLCEDADVVLVNFKPGAAQKLGLDYATLKNKNPQLIYAHLTGYGHDNPRAGYDAIVQAESGFMYLNGEPKGKATKMPVALMDILAAHQLKEAILVALLKKAYTHEGSLIEVSLLDSALVSLANQASNWLVAGDSPQKMGSEHPNIVPYGHVAQTKDQQSLVLGVGTDTQFQLLCKTLNCSELATDTRFESNAQRVKFREELRPLLNEAIVHFESNEILPVLHQANIPAGLIHDIPTALGHAQNLLMKSDGFTGLQTIAFELSGHEKRQLSRPPHLGEHTLEVLGKLRV